MNFEGEAGLRSDPGNRGRSRVDKRTRIQGRSRVEKRTRIQEEEQGLSGAPGYRERIRV